MNKKEFRTKAYPIILEAILRATNGDNVQILVNGLDEKYETLRMAGHILDSIEYNCISNDYIELYNKAVIRVGLDSSFGYNHTLEIV